MAEKLGITPVTVAGGELYESLQRGVIDAAEYSTPYADYTFHLEEVTDYWVAPAWYQSAGCNGVMINLDAWNELPDNYKEIIEMASYLTMFDAIHRYDYNDIGATNDIWPAAPSSQSGIRKLGIPSVQPQKRFMRRHALNLNGLTPAIPPCWITRRISRSIGICWICTAFGI